MFHTAIPGLENPPPELIAFTQHVKKNTHIPNALAALNAKDPNLLRMLKVIQLGISNDLIFRHEDADIYLIYLIATRQISFSQGMNVYFYLMTLMQFTVEQQLAPVDEDIKVVNAVTIAQLKSGDKLSPFGAKFAKCLYQNRIHGDNTVKLSDYESTILSLEHLSDQWVVSIKYRFLEGDRPLSMKDVSPHDQVCWLLRAVTLHSPLLVYQKEEQYIKVWIPSYELMNKILSLLYRLPPKMIPCLGTLTPTTLNSLYHQKNTHPIAFYSKRISSNIKLVHDRRGGPLGAALHDYGHTIWMARIAYNHRQIILHHMIPKLLEERDKIENVNSDVKEIIRGAKGSMPQKLNYASHLYSFLSTIIYDLSDFNLSDYTRFSDDHADRFQQYIKKCFNLKFNIENEFSGAYEQKCYPRLLNIIAMLAQGDVVAKQVWMYVINLMLQWRLLQFPKDKECMERILQDAGHSLESLSVLPFYQKYGHFTVFKQPVLGEGEVSKEVRNVSVHSNK